MKTLLAVIFLIIPMRAFSNDDTSKRDRAFEKTLYWTIGPQEYEKYKSQKETGKHKVRQELLDMYRSAHPNYNFPKDSNELVEKQSRQILNYFYDNYRFGELKYDEIRDKVWDMFTKMPLSDFETAINMVINKYYKFGKYFEGEEWRKEYQVDFNERFGSKSTMEFLVGMKPADIPKMLEMLDEIKY
jgi:hypothetical protein